MAVKFQNKKLNKKDHAKVDRDAGIVRGFVKYEVLHSVIKRVPWKKVSGSIRKIIFKI